MPKVHRYGVSSPTALLRRDNRNALMLEIRKQVDAEARKLGVTVTDVRIRRADLPRAIS